MNKAKLTTVLAVVGCIGWAAASAMAARGGLKHADIRKNRSMTATDYAKCYGGAALIGTASTAAIIYGNHLSNNIIKEVVASAGTAVAASSAMLMEHKDAAKRVFGPDAEKKIQEDIHKNKLSEIESNNQKIEIYDRVGKVSFVRTIPEVEQAIHEMNRELYSNFYVPWKRLYENLNLPERIVNSVDDSIGYWLDGETESYNASFSSANTIWIDLTYYFTRNRNGNFICEISPEYGPYEHDESEFTIE